MHYTTLRSAVETTELFVTLQLDICPQNCQLTLLYVISGGFIISRKSCNVHVYTQLLYTDYFITFCEILMFL